jgi:hypothetical protein
MVPGTGRPAPRQAGRNKKEAVTLFLFLPSLLGRGTARTSKT